MISSHIVARVHRAIRVGAPSRSARRTWPYAFLGLALTAACSSNPTPGPTSGAHRPTVPAPSRPASAAPIPSRSPAVIRVAARYRLPIASSGPAAVLGHDLWVALVHLPMRHIGATDTPGHLVDLDTRTGRVRATVDIGSYPSGIVASDDRIWVATVPGDIHPPARDAHRVTEFDRHGTVIHRYHVPDPEAITSAPAGVWVMTYTGGVTRLQHIHDGHADPPVNIPDMTATGDAVAECPDGLYSAGTDVGGMGVVTRFSRTGKDPHSTRVTWTGYAHLTCTDNGVLLTSHNSITRITADGATSTITPPSGRIQATAATATGIWLLVDPEHGSHFDLVPVDPGKPAVGRPHPIPGTSTIAGGKPGIWGISTGRVTKIELR